MRTCACARGIVSLEFKTVTIKRSDSADNDGNDGDKNSLSVVLQDDMKARQFRNETEIKM